MLFFFSIRVLVIIEFALFKSLKFAKSYKSDLIAELMGGFGKFDSSRSWFRESQEIVLF